MADVSSFNPFGPSSDSGNNPGARQGPPPGNPFGPSSGMPGPPPGPSGAPPSPTPGQAFTVAGPPSGLLFAAGAIALIGLGAGIAGVIERNWISAIGWALAGPVAIVVLGLFMAADTKRQAEPVYARPGWLSAVYGIVAALIVIGIVVASVGIALWIGHL